MHKTEQIKLWEQNYADDQENLYKNPLVRAVFDLGHKYIARLGRGIHGKILDVGSGMGYHLKFEKLMQDRRYICLDKDPKMLCKINHVYVEKLVGTCSQIPLPDQSIDLVVASHILEHLSDLPHDIDEIKRVLKNQGKVIVVLPCDPGLLWKILTYITPSRRRLKKLGIDYDVVMRHEHVNTYQVCRKVIKQNFNILNEKYYPFFIPSHDLNILCCLLLSKK
jgi:ubiquinone/menaquinone biosynthesis C-methylase UbiE